MFVIILVYTYMSIYIIMLCCVCLDRDGIAVGGRRGGEEWIYLYTSIAIYISTPCRSGKVFPYIIVGGYKGKVNKLIISKVS